MNNPTETLPAIELKIEGMSCGHCVRAVKEALLRGPSVVEAEVNLEAGRAKVWHEGLATVESLVAEVESEGFAAAEV